MWRRSIRGVRVSVTILYPEPLGLDWWPWSPGAWSNMSWADLQTELMRTGLLCIKHGTELTYRVDVEAAEEAPGQTRC